METAYAQERERFFSLYISPLSPLPLGIINLLTGRRSLHDFQPPPLPPQPDIIKLVPGPPPPSLLSPPPPPPASATTRSFTFNWEINLARGIVTRNIYKGAVRAGVNTGFQFRALSIPFFARSFPTSLISR